MDQPEDKVVELNAHAPTVESVTSRLARLKGIEHISAVIVWDNGYVQVVGDSKPIPQWALASVILSAYVTDQCKLEE